MPNYGMKFSEEFMTKVDEQARLAGLKREEFLEVVVNTALADERQPSTAPVGSRSGVRIAYVCERCRSKEDNLVPRVFVAPGDPHPECRTHGKMTLQANNPYRGRPT